MIVLVMYLAISLAIGIHGYIVAKELKDEDYFENK